MENYKEYEFIKITSENSNDGNIFHYRATDSDTPTDCENNTNNIDDKFDIVHKLKPHTFEEKININDSDITQISFDFIDENKKINDIININENISVSDNASEINDLFKL